MITEPRAVIALTNDCVFGHLFYADLMARTMGPKGEEKNGWPEDIVFTGLGNGNVNKKDTSGGTALPT